jgi:hypothetical protein
MYKNRKKSWFKSFSVIVVADTRNSSGEINLEMYRIGSQ